MSTEQYRKRLILLSQCAQSVEKQAMVLELCRRDINTWFSLLAWTFDPRTQPGPLPFHLYPFQKEALQKICHAIEHGEDLLIEKSRDMGMSWLILLTFLWYWRFQPGSHFLVGSRRQDAVDNKGDRGSLLEKCRFALSYLPQWALPDGFNLKQHTPLLKIINPANGNTIVGESSNPQFSRGGRYRAILMDEFPFWQHDDSAFAAAGQSSPCRLLVGTPYGKHNTFAQLRFGGNFNVLTCHWQDHPDKDDDWYAEQAKRMSANELARELDINYNLSLANRVFMDFGPQHVVDELPVLANQRIIRCWDFGYHCPAVVIAQIDDNGVVRVLKELVGHQTVLATFAQGVLEVCEKDFGSRAMFEDLCDPAGSQKSDKGDRTSVDVLNSLGVYPYYQRTRILRGIELIRQKLIGQPDDSGEMQPQLLINRHQCKHLIDAFEGGYRYPNEDSELPLEEHPYEDVMDCLRYIIAIKCDFNRAGENPRFHHRPKRYTDNGNAYTGY